MLSKIYYGLTFTFLERELIYIGFGVTFGK